MHVLELWRYPVKSMVGERVERAEVDRGGVAGDRGHAVVDLETGFVLTARREPRLLLASARRRGDGTVEITLPDGTVASGGDALSRWLGRPVALRPADPDVAGRYETLLDFEQEDGAEWLSWEGPPGPFHDSTHTRVSLVSEETVGGWDVRRFRPNVVVSGGGEDALVGSSVRIGGAVLDVVKQVDRCVMVTRPQRDGVERDLDVLRTINRERGGNLAVGALVRRGGPVRVGDEVTVAGS